MFTYLKSWDVYYSITSVYYLVLFSNAIVTEKKKIQKLFIAQLFVKCDWSFKIMFEPFFVSHYSRFGILQGQTFMDHFVSSLTY